MDFDSRMSVYYPIYYTHNKSVSFKFKSSENRNVMMDIAGDSIGQNPEIRENFF